MTDFPSLRRRRLLVLKENLDFFDLSRSAALVSECGPGVTGAFLRDECGVARVERAGDGECHDARPSADFAVVAEVLDADPDPDRSLRTLRERVVPEGWLFASISYNPVEWGVDDLHHGRRRRLTRRGVIELFEGAGWNVIRTIDPTFPTFWLMRRYYLARARGTAWRPEEFTAVGLSSSLSSWRTVRAFNRYFESVFRGYELFLVCQRREGDDLCPVCRSARLRHRFFFEKWGFQRCESCGTEKLQPEIREDLYNKGYYTREGKRFSSLMESLVTWFRRRRADFIEGLGAPTRKILDIGCGRGITLSELKRRGWRALGTQLSEAAADHARRLGVEVIVGDIDRLPREEKFGVITMYHVIEHVKDVRGTVDLLVEMLEPGGILVLEYPNARSAMKAAFGPGWFAYDPPNHRYQIDPVTLSDTLGVLGCALVAEKHHSLEYSFYTFAQTLANVAMPFARDGLFRCLLRREKPSTTPEKIAAFLSAPLFLILAPIFPFYQFAAGFLGRGCIVTQVFRKAGPLSDSAT